MGISGFSLGSLGTKWHLGAGSVARHKIYYKGEGDASPKFGPWWVLWVCVCPWFIFAPKCSNYALTNLLFGLCKSMWVIELLVNLPSPIHSSSMPFTPEALWTREHAPTPSPSAIHLWTCSWVDERTWGCVTNQTFPYTPKVGTLYFELVTLFHHKWHPWKCVKNLVGMKHRTQALFQHFNYTKIIHKDHEFNLSIIMECYYCA